MVSENKIILRGFNDGYNLYQSHPNLATKIARGFSNPKHPYADAFIGGTLQKIKEERNIDKSPPELER